ncbi:hypothetical protein RZS08_17260, partial [Arthrospira platensis SPKY1]|nr:hypothetical protein [Arthrospira platensis SPKY1]
SAKKMPACAGINHIEVEEGDKKLLKRSPPGGRRASGGPPLQGQFGQALNGETDEFGTLALAGEGSGLDRGALPQLEGLIGADARLAGNPGEDLRSVHEVIPSMLRGGSTVLPFVCASRVVAMV